MEDGFNPVTTLIVYAVFALVIGLFTARKNRRLGLGAHRRLVLFYRVDYPGIHALPLSEMPASNLQPPMEEPNLSALRKALTRFRFDHGSGSTKDSISLCQVLEVGQRCAAARWQTGK